MREITIDLPAHRGAATPDAIKMARMRERLKDAEERAAIYGTLADIGGVLLVLTVVMLFYMV